MELSFEIRMPSDGYGAGSGNGDGYGDGAGYGDGDGYGAALARKFAPNAEGVVALWKSNASGSPCNGGYGPPVHAGLMERSTGPLTLCVRGNLHASFRPEKWSGSRLWTVALHGPVQTDGEKLCSLTREIIAEIKPKNTTR